MGGAGSWQIGLHEPDRFCGLEIDAGVIGNRLSLVDLSRPEQAATATYGILIDQGLNATNVPLVAYAGANDAQLAASTSIREQLEREGCTIEATGPYRFTGKDIAALFLANPGQGHSHATGDTARQIDAFTAANFSRGRVVPDHVRFVTYTTRYNRIYWLTIDGLQQHFARATVDASRDATGAHYVIKTHNVSRLILTDGAAARGVTIDGEALSVPPAGTIHFAHEGGHWAVADPAAPASLVKRHNLQGPISDAFFDSFLCVTPTGTADSALVDEHARQELARFTEAFAREYCGVARAKADTAVTTADIEQNNLILFGDPRSNQVLGKIAARLPIQWTREQIVVGSKTYGAADHVPILIYPNPLNPARYVVINAGLPAPGRGTAGTGDFAVLHLRPASADAPAAETVLAGVFDESWQLPPPSP